MPFICNELDDAQSVCISRLIMGLSDKHPLRKDYDDGLTVFVSGSFVIFQSKNGFYFRRLFNSGLYDTLVDEMTRTREYLCGAFELVNNDTSVAQQLLDRFQDSYGIKLANQIEHTIVNFMGKDLLLAKFPSSVVRHMMIHQGGLLRTNFSGSVESLKQIPTLMKFTQITAESGPYTSALVTEYTAGQLAIVQTLHYDILREIISRPGLGITVGPIAQWDA